MLKRKQSIIVFAVLIVILVLELLPYGIVLEFGHLSPDLSISYYEQHFSYFDLIVYGYGNVGALFTAILTCVLLVLSIINLLVDNDKIKTTIKIVSLIALVASLAPLIVNSYSVIGGVISLLLLVIVVISMKNDVNDSES